MNYGMKDEGFSERKCAGCGMMFTPNSSQALFLCNNCLEEPNQRDENRPSKPLNFLDLLYFIILTVISDFLGYFLPPLYLTIDETLEISTSKPFRTIVNWGSVIIVSILILTWFTWCVIWVAMVFFGENLA
jgi:hypothetical protein